MENKVTQIKIIFSLAMFSFFAFAVEFKSGWWAFSGLGAGLFLVILYVRDNMLNDVHTLSNRAIFFAIAPLIAIPALLQAGAGIFAFISAFALIQTGEYLRKRAKRDLAVVEGGAE